MQDTQKNRVKSGKAHLKKNSSSSGEWSIGFIGHYSTIKCLLLLCVLWKYYKWYRLIVHSVLQFKTIWRRIGSVHPVIATIGSVHPVIATKATKATKAILLLICNGNL